uniref:Uncharacterized protein n=1 Tax=Meloidogyne enterolobii TaxID=390850 RepID=A0A6V7UTX4_MELEN|nr:unnamed protein product [Meloidogyne enterolobii]
MISGSGVGNLYTNFWRFRHPSITSVTLFVYLKTCSDCINKKHFDLSGKDSSALQIWYKLY